jgi:hypothetical protein
MLTDVITLYLFDVQDIPQFFDINVHALRSKHKEVDSDNEEQILLKSHGLD